MIRPGMATMPVPSMMVFGGWAGADLLMETILPPSMPMYAPKMTSIRGFMVTAVTLEINVSKENNLS